MSNNSRFVGAIQRQAGGVAAAAEGGDDRCLQAELAERKGSIWHEQEGDACQRGGSGGAERREGNIGLRAASEGDDAVVYDELIRRTNAGNAKLQAIRGGGGALQIEHCADADADVLKGKSADGAVAIGEIDAAAGIEGECGSGVADLDIAGAGIGGESGPGGDGDGGFTERRTGGVEDDLARVDLGGAGVCI